MGTWNIISRMIPDECGRRVACRIDAENFPVFFLYPERDGRRSVIPAFVEDTTSVALLAVTIPAHVFATAIGPRK